MRYLIKGTIILLALILVGSVGFYTHWQTAAPDQTCASCHEIEGAHESWTRSSHQDIKCAKCHGTALSSGVTGMKDKGQMVFTHFRRNQGDEVRFHEQQMIASMERCRECHASVYSNWLSSGHSATYAAIFLDEKHNAEEQLSASCLRCHGMFFEGTISKLVVPLDIQGPWRLIDAQMASVPTIPCMACHNIHVDGSIAVRPDYSSPATIAAIRKQRTAKVSFYDRYEKTHFEASELPPLQLSHKNDSVQVAADENQRVCIQCHAPNAFHQAGSSDDRTPRGVHEGLSCDACHASHSNDASESCTNCHPQLSNCGLDVTKMKTTYIDPTSPNNIHFIACEDCHTQEFLN